MSEVQVESTGPCRTNPYFKIYFDFGYYLCVAPFRFKLDASGNRFILHKNSLQQCLCAIRHLIVLLIRLATAAGRNPKENIRVIYYYTIVQTISTTLYHLTLCSAFWRSQTKIGNFINLNAMFVRSFPTKIVLMCLLTSLMSILSPLFGYEVINSSSKSIPLIILGYLQRAKYFFFLDNTSKLGITEASYSDLCHLSWMDISLISFQFLAQASDQLMETFTTLFLVVASLTLLDATLNFKQNYLSFKHEYDHFDRILDKFYHLKDLSSELDSFLGPTAFAYAIDAVLYFSVNLDEIFINPDWYSKCIIIYYLLHDASFLLISGQICQEVRHFKSWLLKREHRSILASHEDLNLLLEDLSYNPIAINGYGKFIIDNSFVGNVLITLITLFIIVLQFKPN